MTTIDIISTYEQVFMTDHPGMIYEDCNGLRCTNQGVYEETVLESKGCPDARNIQENIDAGNIHVSGSSSQEKGEVESFRLFRLGGFELIASDDRKFLKSLEKCNIPYLTSSSLIVYLFHKKRLTGKDTIKYIDSLKAHISNDQYRTAISEVLRWER